MKRVVVAVVGASGSGITSFIRLASGQQVDTSGDLISSTSSSQATSLIQGDCEYVLIDTPGWNRAGKTNYEIFQMFAETLIQAAFRGLEISGIIYLHSLIDNRLRESTMETLVALRNLCGTGNLSHIRLLTTTLGVRVMEDQFAHREAHLLNSDRLFRQFTAKGSKFQRFGNNQYSALEILRDFRDMGTFTPDIQHEMSTMEMPFAATSVSLALRPPEVESSNTESVTERMKAAQREIEMKDAALFRMRKEHRDAIREMDEQWEERLQETAEKAERRFSKRYDKLEAERQRLAIALRRAERMLEEFTLVQNHKNSSPRPSPGPNNGGHHSNQSSESVKDPFEEGPQSSTKVRWQNKKRKTQLKSAALDSLMQMTGLEHVKSQILDIVDRVETVKQQGTDLKKERFSATLLGNPGTGKTTVARLYAQCLMDIGVLPGSHFIEKTGSSLASAGVKSLEEDIEAIKKAGGGALFVDEAYQLSDPRSFHGSQILEHLLGEIEGNVGSIVFLFAGYNREMENFFEHNAGIPRRIPLRFDFADYTDEELLSILDGLIKEKFGGQMKIEDGINGLYTGIMIRRLGRLRGKRGFGNAGALQNAFNQIANRQAKRLQLARSQNRSPDYFFLTRDDIIGQDPSRVMRESPAWKKLQALVGLDSVKQSVQAMIDQMAYNYKREISGKPVIQPALNKLFLGNPGTGKTTVAKLYGQILAEIGMLSKGEVVVKQPSDFIGSVIGQSEENTKKILANSLGKVLVIDEAYVFGPDSSKGGGGANSYKEDVINTIVAEVHNVPGDDRCILLLGYEEPMQEMFRLVNDGLARRFPMDDAFRFEDFNDLELRQILDMKLVQQEIKATHAARSVAGKVLKQRKRRPKFGNAGEIDNLLTRAINNFQRRTSRLPVNEDADMIFEPADFDPEFNRSENAATSTDELFKDTYGLSDIVERLKGYQKTAKTLEAVGQDCTDLIPTRFVFKGPPGTGKTLTARKMGKIFYDMGFLAYDEVLECSATDLVGEYIGQTGPKTQALFEKALGKVLFIDEAYRLAEGHFAKEAIEELVDITTKPKFQNNLIVILGGYEEDMNRLLEMNDGLSSRFEEEVIFPNIPPQNCIQILNQFLSSKQVQLKALTDRRSAQYTEMIEKFSELVNLPNWGNARDIQNVGKDMVRSAYKDSADRSEALQLPLDLSFESALACAKRKFDTLQSRASKRQQHAPGQMGYSVLTPAFSQHHQPAFDFLSTRQSRPSQVTNTGSRVVEETEEAETPLQDVRNTTAQVQRDPGVSDAIWRQLQVDQRREQQTRQEAQAALAQKQAHLERAKRAEREAAEARMELMKRVAREAAEAEQLRIQREEAARLEERRREMLRAAQVEFERLRAQEEEQRRKEAEVQRKLQVIGKCPSGFAWINQGSGYRCSAGGHFVTNAQLGLS